METPTLHRSASACAPARCVAAIAIAFASLAVKQPVVAQPRLPDGIVIPSLQPDGKLMRTSVRFDV